MKSPCGLKSTGDLPICTCSLILDWAVVWQPISISFFMKVEMRLRLHKLENVLFFLALSICMKFCCKIGLHYGCVSDHVRDQSMVISISSTLISSVLHWKLYHIHIGT